jgi:peptidoglycan hydrolase-like protein with peptidoglycan-binding domain
MSKKILGAAVVLAVIAAVFAAAPAVKADAASCSAVKALITAGLISADKIATAEAAAGCTSTSAAYMFTKDLTVGSTGADVSALQAKLGVTPATGYFGAITKAAVVAYQAANKLPTTGYVGQLTRAVLNYVAPSVPSTPATPSTPSTSSNDLDGTDGEISDVNELSSYNNEEVGEGEEEIKVAGFEVESSKDGDIQIKSVKIELSATSSGQSDNIDDYITGLTVWMGSTKVGAADVEDFNEESTNGVWSKTISLKDAVVKADKTVKFYVSLDAANTFDSSDISGADMDLRLVNIRYTDGSNVTTTDDSSGEIGFSVPVNFVDFSTAADIELKVSLDSSSPDAAVVLVDEEDNTDEIVLLKGKIKIDGDSDVLVDELPITLTASTGTVASVTNNVTLSIDGEEYSESVNSSASSATTTFDNLDLTLTAGKTYTFTIMADINDIETGSFDEGTSLTASMTGTNVDYIDAEDEEGDQLDDSSEKSGTAVGEAQTFYSSGIVVTVNDVRSEIDKNDSTDDDSITYTVELTIEAFGDNAYVSHATTTDVSYLYTNTAPTVNESRLSADDEDTQDDPSYNYFFLNEGDTRDFTYTLILTASTSATTISNFKMTDIGWGLTPTSISSYGGDLDDTAVVGSKLLD